MGHTRQRLSLTPIPPLCTSPAERNTTLARSKAAGLKRTISALWIARIAGISLWKGQYDAFVAPFTLAPYSKNGIRRGGAMKLIDWHSTIIRWSAVAFSLGAWAGIVVVVRHLVG